MESDFIGCLAPRINIFNEKTFSTNSQYMGVLRFRDATAEAVQLLGSNIHPAYMPVRCSVKAFIFQYPIAVQLVAQNTTVV